MLFEISAGGRTGPVRIATLLAFPLARKGGISTFVAHLLPALERRFVVDLLLIAPPRTRGRAGDRLSQATLAVQQCLQLIRHRPDIVHTHEHPAHLAAAVAYRAVAGKHVRVVHTVHIEPAERRSWWKRVMLGWLLARCWAVTAVSRHTAAQLANIAEPAPTTIRIVPGAAELRVRQATDPEVQAFRDEHHLGNGPVLCQIGLNFWLKAVGAMRLVQSLPAVRAAFPDVRLVLVGGGHFERNVEAAARVAGVSDAVILTGFIDDVTLPLAAADLYCHVTLQDACPLSLLEAMRSGKPVVAARRGGIPEVISSGVDGILVEPEPAAIAHAIINLLAHPPDARTLGDCAAVTAQRRFTWERVADDFGLLFGLQHRED